MPEKKQEHIHKFKRIKYKSGTYSFFCALPDCNKKMNPALALGKRSICWRCGEPFILNEYSLRLANPHCEKCHKPKKEEEYKGTGIDTLITDESAPLTLAERLSKAVQQRTIESEDEI
jgi:hypothetical protein